MDFIAVNFFMRAVGDMTEIRIEQNDYIERRKYYE